MNKVYLGLPAYNEEASIDPLFSRIEKLRATLPNPLTVLIYDDGCRDNTKARVTAWMDRLEIVYLDGGVNKGLGTAMNELLTGFAGRAADGDVLVVMDCDDTHDPAQIPQMLTVLDRHPKTSVVTASRYRRGATVTGVPFYRLVLATGAAMLYKAVHPIWHARDYTCGYRAYRHSIVAKALQHFTTPLLKERGFACMAELLLKLHRAGAKIREIPLQLAYDNKLSASKMDVSGNTIRQLKKLLHWRFKGMQ